jgi:hypothetical protein
MQLSVSLLDKPDLEHAVLKPACCESPKEKNKPQAGNHKLPTISPASNIGGGDPRPNKTKARAITIMAQFAS